MTLLATLVALTPSAHADANELSLHLQSTFGRLTMIDRTHGDQPMGVVFQSLAGRITYATHNWLAYEANLTLERPFAAMSHQDPWFGRTSHMYTAFWVRGDLGITLRLGSRWVPTVHAAAGIQIAMKKLWAINDGWVHSMKLPSQREPVVTLGLGLDHRHSERWSLGFAALYRRTFLLDHTVYSSISLMLHAGYYLYPSFFR